MRHCLMYQGGFERNFPELKKGSSMFLGTDGSQHNIPAVPAEVDGVCVGYMEKAGKKFAAVRILKGGSDIVLHNEVLLDPSRHMSHVRRFSPEPTIVDDGAMATLLADAMQKNPDQQNEIAKVRATFSLSGAH